LLIEDDTEDESASSSNATAAGWSGITPGR